MKLKNKHKLTNNEHKELLGLIKKYNPSNNVFFVIDDGKTDFKRYNQLISKILY